MPLKLGVLMDPISQIKIEKDSTFAMLLEAQRRKYSIYYMDKLCSPRIFLRQICNLLFKNI